mgnify:CR=1 FL=1
MPYKLAEYHGDTLAVPQLVVSHLTQTDGDTIRAALYLLQTGDTDPRTMARALGLSSVEAAKRALQYWAGAGLLVNDRGGAPIPEPEKPQKIDLANLNDPYVAVLRQFLRRVEDTFQTAETAVPLEYGTLFGCRRSLFPVKDECRPYRLDVVPQFLFAVKRHIRLSKGRLPPSAPCRAGRNRKTGRSCRPRGHRRRTRCRQAAGVYG